MLFKRIEKYAIKGLISGRIIALYQGHNKAIVRAKKLNTNDYINEPYTVIKIKALYKDKNKIQNSLH